MKIYLAAAYSQLAETREKAKELESIGLECTSRWLKETAPPNCTMTDFTDSYLLSTAIVDIEDILAADVTVLFTTDEPLPRGGRHFESGFAYGRGRKLMTVGPIENIFHFLPDTVHFEKWEDAKCFLLAEKYKRGPIDHRTARAAISHANL